MIKIQIARNIAKNIPNLQTNLKKANMPYSPEEFVNRTFMSAGYLTFGILFIEFMFLRNSNTLLKLILIVLGSLPVVFATMFFYFLQLPIVRMTKIDKDINKEIVYAGRFLMVELESGVTLYNAMKTVGTNFSFVGAYFREIIEKVNIGTPIEDAVSETIEKSPSQALTKVLWQISNSLLTGSDIAEPLDTVIETLVREQQIAMDEYSKKLNPMAMFYMLIAVILPSLGVTMITIISIFSGLTLNLNLLLLFAGLSAFMQFMFIAMINSIRPPVEF